MKKTYLMSFAAVLAVFLLAFAVMLPLKADAQYKSSADIGDLKFLSATVPTVIQSGQSPTFFNVKAVKSNDNSTPTPDDGFHIQAGVTRVADINTANAGYQEAINASFDPGTKSWSGVFKPLPAGEYQMDITLYCSIRDYPCKISYDSKQIVHSARFSVVGNASPSPSATPSTTAIPSSISPSSAYCISFNRNLGIGMRGNEVTMLTAVLSREGFLGGKSEIYDEEIAAAVVKLQAKYGIMQTGYFGPLTRAKVNSLYPCANGSIDDVARDFPGNSCFGFSMRLIRGSEGVQVEALQNWLIRKGYDIPDISNRTASTGFFGVQTVAALTRYQQAVGLPVTGALDSATLTKINEACGKGASVSPTPTPTYSTSPSVSTVASSRPYISSVAGKAAGNFEIDAGGTVGIIGRNFSHTTTATRVVIDGKICPVTQVSDTLVYCTAPTDLRVGQTYNLYLYNSNGQSNVVGIRVLSILNQNTSSVTPTPTYSTSPVYTPISTTAAPRLNVSIAGTSGTGYVSAGSAGQTLGSFSVTAVNEPVTVRDMVFILNISPMNTTPVTELTLVNEYGQAISSAVNASPQSSNGTIYSSSQRFVIPGPITFQVGSHNYSIKGRVPSLFVNNSRISLASNPSMGWSSAVGQRSGIAVDLSTVPMIYGSPMIVSNPTASPTQTPTSGATSMKDSSSLSASIMQALLNFYRPVEIR